MEERDRLTRKILDREWEMFRAVPSAFPASCQESPDTFRRVRRSIFRFWPCQLPAAYLIELSVAGRRGRNLLTEKYARMDNLIPPSPPIRPSTRLWQSKRPGRKKYGNSIRRYNPFYNMLQFVVR